MRYLRVAKWTKLLPAEALTGSFQTPQAEYLYGRYQGQWIAMCEGSTCEVLPDDESAGRIAAIALCQNPDARNVLVVGSGLALCRQFLRLPQTKRLIWTHPDSEYVRRLDTFIPAEYRVKDERFHKLDGDIRSLLAEKKQRYDLVILNLPDATGSVLNRYYTEEFYEQARDCLFPGGVLAVRVAGGENIMGTELVNLGASTKMTLQRTFSNLVLTPGEDTWFIASDSENVTGDPGTLRDRFAGIDRSADILPADALLSIYLPDRASAALESYSAADLPEELLINRDSRPLTHLYSLLLAAKQSGAPITRLVKLLALSGVSAFIVPVFVVILLRLVYILRNTGQGSTSSFDSTFLVFSAGSIGIGVVIVLMYLYQTRFGSLYLHIGVISAVFMTGLTVGALLIGRLLASNNKAHPHLLLLGLILVHSLILAGITLSPVERFTHVIFAVAFVLCGLCTGCYFPLAARQLEDAGFETGRAGSKLETADHLGASVGGVLTSLAVVPVLGTKPALLVFILLLLANAPPAVLKATKIKKAFTSAPAGFSRRALGYSFFGIGLAVVLCSNLLAAAAARLRPALPLYAAQALAPNCQLEKASVVLDNETIDYFKVYDANQSPAGLVFSSADFAPEVRGFGGEINLAVFLDVSGELIDFHIVRSNETPSYLELLAQWEDILKQRNLFGPEPFADVHTVTGATVSSQAVLSALETASHRFAEQVLGRPLQPGTDQKAQRANYIPDTSAMYLIIACLLTLIVIYRGGFWSRLAVLVFNIIAGGVAFNAQYSTEQMVTVLSLHTPTIALSAAFLLVVGIPLLVIIFGNIYCGYLCPFGALQELLAYIVPARFKPELTRNTMRQARFIKYAVLLAFIAFFFLSRNRTTLGADPLISFFSFRFTASDLKYAVLVILAIALLTSVFYTRLWCRYLCPAGAFLSLFNYLALLKRFGPQKRFGRCEFGLTGKDHADCIYCDKCRYEERPAPKQEPLPSPEYARVKRLPHYFVVAVLIGAIFVCGVSAKRFLQVIPVSLEHPTAALASGGEPRDVDLQRVKTMIRQGRLSDKEAEYYRKTE